MVKRISFKPKEVTYIAEISNNLITYTLPKNINKTRVCIDKLRGRPPKKKRELLIQMIVMFEEE